MNFKYILLDLIDFYPLSYFWQSINCNFFTKSVKNMDTQVIDRKPKNNPIQGRCY